MDIAERLELFITNVYSSSAKKNSGDDYQRTFANEGFRKSDWVLEEITNIMSRYGLAAEDIGFLSIGGADGSEVESVLLNTEINHGVLLEYDTGACDIARVRAEKISDHGKQLYVIQGDATARVAEAYEHLRNNGCSAVCISAQAILHELPKRGKSFEDLERFFGKLFSEFETTILISREPCKPVSIPEEVELKIPGIKGDRLKAFLQMISDTCKIETKELQAQPNEFVLTNSTLAVEALHKLLRSREIHEFQYELGENLTSLDTEEFSQLLVAICGPTNVNIDHLTTNGFENEYIDSGVEMRHSSRSKTYLTIPKTHAKIIAVYIKDKNNGTAIQQTSHQSADIQNWKKASYPEIISPNLFNSRKLLGRGVLCDKIREIVANKKQGKVTPIILTGMGGSGKTALARFYAETYQKFYKGIWLIRSEQEQFIIEDLADLRMVFGLPKNEILKRSHQALRALVDIQSQGGPWLLIYDNANDFKSVSQHLPSIGDIDVLVTSQSTSWPSQYSAIPLTKLDISEGEDLLAMESGRSNHDEFGRNLVIELGGLPLAIIAAGAWLKNTPSTTYQEYLDVLNERIKELPESVYDYEKSVYMAITLAIEKTSIPAQTILNVLAFLSPEHIDPEIFIDVTKVAIEQKYVEDIPHSLIEICKDRSQVEQCFADLYRYSLLEKHTNRWTIHRLVQAVQRDRTGGIFGEWPRTTASILVASYPEESDPQYTKNWAKCEALNPHIDSLSNLENGGPCSPAMERLHNQIGTYYWSQREDRSSVMHGIASIRSKRRRQLNPEDPTYGTSYNNLSTRLANLGKLRCAMHFNLKAMSIAKNNPDVPDLSRGTWLNSYAFRLKQIGDRAEENQKPPYYQEARKRYHESLRIERRVHGWVSRQCAYRLNNLGGLHLSAERPGAAIIMHEIALRMRETLAGKNLDSDVAQSQHNLAIAHLAKSNFKTAKTLLETAFNTYVILFEDRPKHPSLKVTGIRLVIALRQNDQQGKADQLMSEYGKILDAKEVVEIERVLAARWNWI